MTRRLTLLTALLLIQLALAAGLAWRHQRLAAPARPTPLLAVDKAQVDGIAIDDGHGQQVTLQRQGDGWQVRELDGFPASATRIDGLLARLADLQRGWPVATSEDALRRFQVAADRYQRRIRLRAGERVLATLYLGTSPGFRQIHARADGDEAVYAVAFNAFDAPARPDDWADRQVLHLHEGDIAAIHYPDFTLQRDDQGQYTLADAGDSERLDVGAARKLARRIADLGFLGVLGRQAPAGVDLDHPALRFTVDRRGDKAPLTYALAPLPAPKATSKDGKKKVEDTPRDWVLKRSDLPWHLKLSSFMAKDLQVQRADLLVKAEEGKEE